MAVKDVYGTKPDGTAFILGRYEVDVNDGSIVIEDIPDHAVYTLYHEVYD